MGAISSVNNWRGEGCENYDDAHDVCLGTKKPTKGTPEWHQHKIAVDTVKNPMKSLLNTKPYSVDDAKKMLKDNYGYSDKDLKDLEVDTTAAVSGKIKCPNCGISVPDVPEDATHEEKLCNKCYEESENDDTFECEKCHKRFDIEDSVKDSKKGEMYCPDCAEKEVKAAEDSGYNFETTEEQVKELTRFFNDQGKWQEEYLDHEDYASNYDHLINEVKVAEPDAMGDEFREFWDSMPKAHQKDAWHWVQDNTKAVFTQAGSPGNAEDNSAHSFPHGGEEEVQVSGLQGTVNGAETNDVYKWLMDGLTPEQIKKAEAESDYPVHNDLLYVNTAYALIEFPVDMAEFKEWYAGAFGKTVESKVQDLHNDLLVHLKKSCETYDEMWESNEQVDWTQAEALVALLKRIKNVLPEHTKAVATTIFAHARSADWDSGEVGNWPALLLAALKQDKVVTAAANHEGFNPSVDVIKKAKDIKVGDMVDLSSCPYLNKHASADFEYAEVVEVEQETPNCTRISYDGIDSVGYKPDQELVVSQ